MYSIKHTSQQPPTRAPAYHPFQRTRLNMSYTCTKKKKKKKKKKKIPFLPPRDESPRTPVNSISPAFAFKNPLKPSILREEKERKKKKIPNLDIFLTSSTVRKIIAPLIDHDREENDGFGWGRWRKRASLIIGRFGSFAMLSPGGEGCIRKRGTPGPIYMLLYRCFVRGRVWWWWTYRYTAHRGRGLRIDKNASQAGASQKRTARMKKMRAGLMRWSCHIEVLAKQIPGRRRGHDVDVRMCRHSPIPVWSTLHPP